MEGKLLIIADAIQNRRNSVFVSSNYESLEYISPAFLHVSDGLLARTWSEIRDETTRSIVFPMYFKFATGR